MNKKVLKTIVFSLIGLLMCLSSFVIFPSNANYASANTDAAENTSENVGEATPRATNIVNFDLAKGVITISPTEYSGYDNTGTKITGPHDSATMYVVSQTNPETETTNNISFEGNNLTCQMTLNGVNSMPGGSNSAPINAISIPAYSNNVKHITLLLQGTNYLKNIYYCTYNVANSKENETYPNSSYYTDSTLKITSASGDGSTDGELYVRTNGKMRWNAGIGGHESHAPITGLTFAGGTIDVRTTAYDDCSAIGGGGNGFAQIDITGGKIYAENYSTGATIGGGIGYSDPGPGAIISISGGEVTAINHGSTRDSDKICGVAIGGGSSYGGVTWDTEINISGGTVKATVNEGYTAIGSGNNNSARSGGNSGDAGKATVNITGGNITSTGSIGGGSTRYRNGGGASVTISGGNIDCTGNIGGGSSTSANGGDATFTITGGKAKISGGIGGGDSQNADGGNATVNMIGGTIKCRSIGGGYSNVNGYNDTGSITITGGSLDSSIAGTPTNGTENGDQEVFLTRVYVYIKNGESESDAVAMTNYKITNGSLHIENIGHVNYYTQNDMYTDEFAYVYLWLPENALVVSAQVDVDGVTLTFNGAVSAKSIGVLKNDETQFCIVNIASFEGYTLYYNNIEFSGSMIIKTDSAFSFEVEFLAGTTLNNCYYSSIDGTVGHLNYVSNNNGRYQYQFTANTNTQIWFSVNIDGTDYFTVDLYSGDVVIEKGTTSNTHKITHNGYVIDNLTEQFYLTSSGYPVLHTVTVNSGNPYVYIDNLIVSNINSVITIKSNATLNLSASTANNQIYSYNSSVIMVEVDGTLNLTIDKSENNRFASLKLYGGENSPVIGGNGNVNIIKKQGILGLILANGCDKSQITADKYSYTTNSLSGALPYSLTMNNGKLVGYKKSGNGLCLPNATHSINTETTFTACAISYIKSNTVNCVESITSSNLNVNITLSSGIAVDSITITREGVSLVQGTDWSYDNASNIITIQGSQAYDNLSVQIITINEIVFIANDYNGIYDGSVHGISITVSSPSNYTIEYSIDNVNFSTTSIERTDVCNITVYWKISATGYPTQSGSNKIVITKAYNSWVSNLVCPSLIAGNAPGPRATAKWGNDNIIYSYYEFDRNELNLVQLSTPPTGEGEYYVKAMLAGNDNYHELVSDYVLFTIKSNLTYISPVVNYNELNTQGGQVDIYSNKSVTILYDFYYYVSAGDIEIITTILPKDTKIVFVDYSSETPYFYYYILPHDMTNVALTNFHKMGTTTPFAMPSEDYVRAKFQFCINFPDSYALGSALNVVSQTVYMQQDTAIKGSVILNFMGRYETQEIVENVNASASDNCLKVDTTITTSDTERELNKVLVYSILNSDNSAAAIPSSAYAILSLSTGEKYTLSFVDNCLIYEMGNRDINANASLIIYNLPSNDYYVKVDIRAIENSEDSYYCLANSTADNSKTSTLVTHTLAENISVYAEIVGGNKDRVIEENVATTKNFNVQSTGFDLSSLTITLYSKSSGQYVQQQTLTYEIVTTTSSYNKQISVLIPALSKGTYRLEFKIGNSLKHYTYVYNIIVD